MPNNQMCYEQNFLAKVILRADFGTHPIAFDAEVTKFSSGIAATFPQSSSNLLMRVDFDVATEGTSGIKHTKAGTQWIHRKSPSGTAQVVLEPTFMALEYGPGDYESFDAFLTEFTLLLNQLYDVFGEFPLDRIGLRYVNEIRLPGKALEWSGVIREELVNAVMAPAVPGGRLLRSMHQLVELHGDDQVLFNYGIFNPDFPAPAAQRFFILDIDCSRTGVVQRNEAIACIKVLNNHSTVAFESSIGDELRKIMGVKK
jgi:uncharacterized protein (TIGR04255 family)